MADRFHHADDAFRESHDDHHDKAAEHELRPLGLAHQPDRERLVDDGADDRARDGLDAAEQHHHQRIHRQRNAEDIRKHAALEIGEQRAANSSEGAGNDESAPLDALAVDADGLAAQRRIAGCPQRKAERRERYDPQRTDCQRGNSQRQPIEMRGTCRPSFRPDAENAVVAAGEAHPWNAIDQTICAKASVSIAK